MIFMDLMANDSFSFAHTQSVFGPSCELAVKIEALVHKRTAGSAEIDVICSSSVDEHSERNETFHLSVANDTCTVKRLCAFTLLRGTRSQPHDTVDSIQ